MKWKQIQNLENMQMKSCQKLHVKFYHVLFDPLA